MEKNTRLFYRDKKNIDFWKVLPPETCKTLFIACLEYEYGEDIPDSLKDKPIETALFLQLKEKIDFNEARWKNDKRRTTSAENGKKGGRPKTSAPMTATSTNEEATDDNGCNYLFDRYDHITSEYSKHPEIFSATDFSSAFQTNDYLFSKLRVDGYKVDELKYVYDEMKENMNNNSKIKY